MNIEIIAVGQKMPTWVDTAVNIYKKRLSSFCHFKIIEIPLQKRTQATQLSQLMAKEAELMLSHINEKNHVVALAIEGKTLSSEALAKKLETIQHSKSTLSLLIGGPEGLTSRILQHANEKWSLSTFTIPHPLVRVMIAEILYRSYSIIHKHPYHK